MTSSRSYAQRTLPNPTRRAQTARLVGGETGAVRHMRCANGLITALLVILHITGPASASEQTSSLSEIMAVCSALQNDPEAVRQELVGLGWKPAVSLEKVANIFFWAVFTRDFVKYDDAALGRASMSDDMGSKLGYLIENADFMSASILGNSALPTGQPTYNKDGFELATIGLSIGKGYCIATGPKAAFDTLTNAAYYIEKWPDQFPKSGRPGISATFGKWNNASVFAAKLDVATIRAMYESIPIKFKYIKKDFDIQILNDLPSAIFHITPKRPQ